MDRELLKKNFESHGFKTSFFDTKEEAAKYLSDTIKETSVGFGGSMTIAAMNLVELLSKNNKVYAHSKNEAPETTHLAREAEFFISSANGVSRTGELVNIDGRGNRVSATLFGPKKVFFVVGKNKIVPSIEEAVDRARNIASPPNCKRLGKNTPCAVNTDKCYDCSSPDRICNAIVLYLRPMMGMEEEVVFVDEELGY